MAGNHNSGGKRAGAGRKAGSETIRTRRISNQLANRELTPLHVMVETMTAFWTQAMAATDVPTQLQYMRKASTSIP